MGTKGTGIGPLCYSWAFPICPHGVTIDLSVVSALQHDLTAAAGPQRGLLYGHALPGGTQIDGRRPLDDVGAKELPKALESARREVVGYYSIREGSAFILSPDEMNAAKEFFRKRGSVVLLIERRANGPAEGSFFFWRGESFVHNLPFPFPIDPGLLAADEAPTLLDAPPPRAVAIMEPAPPQRELSGLGLVAGVIAAAVLLWGGMWWKQDPAPQRARTAVAEPAPVAAQPQADLEIAWDPKVAATAKAGLLKINDGGVLRQMALDPDALRSGKLVYSPLYGRVEVVLKALQSDGDIVEVPTSSHAASITSDAPKTEPPPELPPQKPDKAPVEPPDRRPPARPFTLVSAHVAVASVPAILDPPPAAQPMMAMNPEIPLAPPLRAAVPAPVPPPTLPPPAHASIASGRLIWTGTLLRRGVVELDGRSVSVGALSGALPGVPVAITVSPAEFSGDGLVVYTTDAARNNRTEPASARNGWNKTQFVWDPERVREIAVLEAPNPSNRFSRLALRNDARRCSMLLIDWVAR